MKVRFDTGRKLAMLVGSRPDLLRRGVTIACFCDAGSRPCTSDVLTSVVRNGSSMSTDSRTRNVDTGSSMHDFTGDCIMMRRTSVCVQGLNDASDDDAVLDVGGSGGPAVADRMSHAFPWWRHARCLQSSPVSPVRYALKHKVLRGYRPAERDGFYVTPKLCSVHMLV